MSLQVDIKKRLCDFELNAKFEAETGEVLGILGSSGCGKSMTLRCIAGIVTPDSGKIVLDGKTLFDSEKRINLRPQQRGVGLLFQNYALFPNMTTRQNIMTGLNREKNKAERERICASMIEMLHLDGLENHRPHQLSGGQQQRVALARILSSKPKIVMLDEPFSALDSFLRWQTEMDISDVLKEFGITTLLVSHNRDEIYRMCDKVCVVSDGQFEPRIDVKELFSDPGTISAALLSGCKNYSRIERIDAHHVRAIDWNATLECRREVMPHHAFVGVRSHFFRPGKATKINAIYGKVTKYVDDVHSTVVFVNTGVDSKYSGILVDVDKNRDYIAPESSEICIFVRPDDIMLLRE